MHVLKTILGAGLLMCVTGGSAQAATRPPKPPLVHLHWHQVASHVKGFAADDSYLVYNTAAGITLVDQATHRTTELPHAACQGGRIAPGLGGPWLSGCPYPKPQSPYSPNASDTRLYNIPGHYWVTVPGPPCSDCFPQKVGSDWIKFIEPFNLEYEAPGYRIQNISTGQTEADPAKAGAPFTLDLSSATGTSPLCPPLRDPVLIDGENGALEPADVTMLGQFALATIDFSGADLLERCNSRWRLWLPGDALGGSRLVVWNQEWLDPTSPVPGVLLPSARRFGFDIPRRFHPGISELQGVAVSGRTIYVLGGRGTLWAARVPNVR
jgi:hypothetical protein